MLVREALCDVSVSQMRFRFAAQLKCKTSNRVAATSTDFLE